LCPTLLLIISVWQLGEGWRARYWKTSVCGRLVKKIC
jgi:hypothetical protein